MPKIIRPTYPAQFTVGLLSLIFIISCVASYQVFDLSNHDPNENASVYFGMFLCGLAVVIMALILWEEFLFPVKIKEVEGGMIFRNHGTKLKTQALIYCIIPIIFVFLLLEYEVKPVRFFIFAAICIVAPLIEKLSSGIKNYNDFLMLTDEKIEYKDNEKQGEFYVKDIDNITIVKAEGNIIHEIQIYLKSSNCVIIYLDQMELDAFYESICTFITTHYKQLVKEAKWEEK
ncbi:MAG: heavy metal transporter [Cytophagaceae bacterium]|nr:heavy metal transporter [Cytophagaceae bacterium]